jgi:hypothetical protein
MENNNNKDDTFTPEELAWRLLLDENVNNVQLLAFSDENSVEILFEILLTVYVEMIFNHYKMQYLEFHAEEDEFDDEFDDKFDDEFDDKFDNFKLDLSQINLAMLTDNFDEKIKKLKFILNINEIPFEKYEECKINRYCTVLFKDLLRDKAFFIMNSEYLDPEKRYHFVKNSKYEIKTILRDIFCSFELNGKYYKVNFSN